MWLLLVGCLFLFGFLRHVYVRFYVCPGTLYARRLPNGMDIVGCSGDTLEDIVYHENFEDRTYFRSGVKVDASSYVIDVGANIGLFALSLLKDFPGIKISCVEPVPVLFEACKQNVTRYSLNATDVKCHNVGLGEKECTVPFTYCPQASAMSGQFEDKDVLVAKDKRITSWIAAVLEDGATGGVLPQCVKSVTSLLRGPMGTLVAMVLIPAWILLAIWYAAGTMPRQKFMATITTLDHILKKDGIAQVDLLKVDVEGAELLVMKSISREAFSRIRQIVVEVHDIDNRTNLITTMLKENGFVVSKEEEEHLATHKLLHLDTLYAIRK